MSVWAYMMARSTASHFPTNFPSPESYYLAQTELELLGVRRQSESRDSQSSENHNWDEEWFKSSEIQPAHLDLCKHFFSDIKYPTERYFAVYSLLGDSFLSSTWAHGKQQEHCKHLSVVHLFVAKIQPGKREFRQSSPCFKEFERAWGIEFFDLAKRYA